MVQETRVQSQVKSYQSLKKWYLMPPCLTLSIIRWGSRVKWSNPGNGVASPLHLGVVAIERGGAFGSLSTMVVNFTLLIRYSVRIKLKFLLSFCRYTDWSWYLWFLTGHPSKQLTGLLLLNFSVLAGTGALILTWLTLLVGLTMCWPYPHSSKKKKKKKKKKKCPVYDTKLHLMVKLQFWRSVEFGVPLHCHYALIHFDLEWQYLLGSYLFVK